MAVFEVFGESEWKIRNWFVNEYYAGGCAEEVSFFKILFALAFVALST